MDFQNELEGQVNALDFSTLETFKSDPKPSLGYNQIDDMVNHLRLHPEREKICTKSLSVNGIVIQDDMDIYLKSPGISSSLCKEYLKSPLHGYWSEHQAIKKKSKKYFELGTFAHMAFLEPKHFEKVIVEPVADRSSNKGCDVLIEFYTGVVMRAFHEKLIDNVFYQTVFPCNENYDKIQDRKARIDFLQSYNPYTIIEPEHKAIIGVLQRNYETYGGGIIKEIMKGAINETSFYTSDNGLQVKIRPDAFQIKENIGVDAVISFKTTSCDRIEKFYYDSASHKYDLSEGMYQDVASMVTGREVKTTITIMLQSVPPYLPAVLWWDADDLESGKYKYRQALSIIKDCREKNHYPGFDAHAEADHFGVIKMKLPDWANKEIQPVNI